MKKLFQLLAAVCLAAMPLVGCDKEPGEGGGDGKLSFTLEVTNVTSNGATFKVTPSDTKATYYFGFTQTENINEAGSAKSYVENYFAALKELGGDDFVYADYLFKGVQTQTSEDGLSANAEYCLFAVGMDDAGKLTTDVATKTFKTEPAAAVDYPTVAVLDVTSDSVEYSVLTNGYEGKYFVYYVESYYFDPEDEDHVAESLEEWIKDYLSMYDDEFMKPYLAEMLYEGDLLNKVTDGLAPSTEYTMFCVGVDPETLELTTEVSSYEFATLAYEGADDLTFNVSVNGYKITVVPSDEDMTYAYVLDVARFFITDGIEDEGNDGMFIDDLLKFYGADYKPTTYKDLWTIDADAEVNASGRPADEVYWLVIFGYDKESGWTKGIYKNLNLTFEAVDTNATTNLTGDVTVTVNGMMPMSSTFEEYGYWHRNFDFYAYDDNYVEHHLLVDLYASDEYAPYEGKYPILFSTMDMEGYARAGYYNDDNDKAGVWYFNDNGDVAAAATGEEYFVEVTSTGDSTYSVHAVFKDEKGHTVDFTWNGYIF